MRYTVVTPCLNPGPLLRDTVESVIRQRSVLDARDTLEYLIIDGGSTDGTLEYLRSLRHDDVRWISEPDRGMYDALAKGLTLASGDVHSYLDAGDMYHPGAFDVVSDVLPMTRGWLTGMAVGYNAAGAVISATTPFRYRRTGFRTGVYDAGRSGVLQQESTFWASGFTEKVDLAVLRELKLAGDFYLWWSFSAYADIDIVSALLGGFRHYGNHLSEDLSAYRREIRSFAEDPTLVHRMRGRADRLLGYMPMPLKKRLNPRLIRWKDGTWE